MPEIQNPFAPWHLPLLVPLWIIQTVLALVFLIAVPIIASENRQYYRPGMDARYAWPFISFDCTKSVL